MEVRAVEVGNGSDIRPVGFQDFQKMKSGKLSKMTNFLGRLIQSVRAGERTPVEEIQGSSRANRVLWSNWERFMPSRLSLNPCCRSS